MKYYLTIKKITAICSNMNGPRDYHIKWGNPDRKRQISYDIAYIYKLKNIYKWIYLENRNKPIDIENKLVVTKGEVGDKLGVWG